jgi:hypothetical protein
MQLVGVPSLVLFLRVENTDSIQETLVLTWPGPVLSPVTMRSFHVGNGVVMLPLLVIGLRNPRSIRVTWLLVLLCLPCVEGRS